MSAIKNVVATINGSNYTLTYNATTKKYEATITAPTTTSYNVNAGHYYGITVKATDTAGNIATVSDSTLDALKLRVKETVKPTINITNLGANAYITNNSPSITFTVTDSGSGINKGTVKFKVDNVSKTLPTPTTITNGFSYTVTCEGLSEGSHSIAIDVTDNDGNVATTFTRSFTVDTVPPVLNITAPTNNLDTNNASVTVSGTTNDATSSPVTVSIKVNSGTATTATVNADGTFSKAVTLVEGANTITITATDKAGKTTTVTRIVNLDTSIPVFGNIVVTPNPVNTGATYTITVEVNS